MATIHKMSGESALIITLAESPKPVNTATKINEDVFEPATSISELPKSENVNLEGFAACSRNAERPKLFLPPNGMQELPWKTKIGWETSHRKEAEDGVGLVDDGRQNRYIAIKKQIFQATCSPYTYSMLFLLLNAVVLSMTLNCLISIGGIWS